MSETNNKKFCRILCVLIFIISSVVLLIGTGYILSEDKTSSGIIRFLYQYYGVYTYAIVTLAVSQLTLIFFHRELPTLPDTILRMAVYMTAAAAAFGLYYIQYSEEGPDLRILAGYAAAAILSFVVTLVFDVIFRHPPKLLSLFHSNKYGFFFFCFLSVRFLLNYPGSINQWVTIWYAMDYQTAGFGSRLLMGSILRLFLNGGFVSKEIIYLFVILSIVCMIVLVSYLLGKFVKKCAPSHREAVWFLTLCYLVSPFSIEHIWTGEMGRLESFDLLFILLFLIGFHKIKNIYAKYLLACFVSVACIACYQGYVFMYFPILFTIVALETADKTDHRKINIAGTICVFLVNVVVSILFQFGSKLRYENVENLYAILENHTDIDMTVGTLNCEYVMDIQKRWYAFTYQFLFAGNEHPREKTFLLMIILFPLIILFMCMWRKLYHSEIRRIVFWILLSDLAILPQIILSMDWPRWYASLGCVQFFQIFYLIYKQPAAAEEMLASLTRFINKYRLLCLLFLIYLMPLGKIHGFQFPAEADTLMDIIRMISRRTFQFIWK